MSIISITTIFRSNCFLYINKENFFLEIKNGELIKSDKCFKFEIFSTNPISTLGLILFNCGDFFGQTPYLIYIDENNDNYNLDFIRHSKIPFEQKIIYSINGLALHYIENNLIFKERSVNNNPYLVSIHLDGNYEHYTNSIDYLFIPFSTKLILKNDSFNEYIMLMGEAIQNNKDNKIIKIVDAKLKSININSYYFIMFDFFNNKRRILFNEKFLVLKFNIRKNFYFDTYFDIDTENVVEIEEL
jgi:hypothetical protein